MADLKILGREVFYSGNKAVGALRYEDNPDIEERTYAICKKPFKKIVFDKFSKKLQGKKCVTIRCSVDMKERKRVLKNVSCDRKAKYKDVALFSGALIDLDNYSPFENLDSTTRIYNNYEKSDLREFDDDRFGDLEEKNKDMLERIYESYNM